MTTHKNETSSRALARKSVDWGRMTAVFRPFLPMLLAILTLTFIMLTVQAWRTSASSERQAASKTLRQEVAFDYTAVPSKSTLYPLAAKLGRKPSYLVKLTSQFTVDISSRIFAPEGTEVSGTYSVILNLQAGKFWSKDYPLVPTRSFSGTGEFTAFELPVNIPIHDYLAFAAQVAKEAQTSPGTYTLTVYPYIKAQLKDGAESLVNEFLPLFSFDLSGTQLVPRGLPKEGYSETQDVTPDLVQEQTTSAKVTESVSNSLGLFGLAIPVIVGRILYSCMALAALVSTIWLEIGRSQRRPRLTETERIIKRYGSRIVHVQAGAFDSQHQTAILGSFKALLAMADERGRPIFHSSCNDGVPQTDGFFLLDEGIRFCYLARPGGGMVIE